MMTPEEEVINLEAALRLIVSIKAQVEKARSADEQLMGLATALLAVHDIADKTLCDLDTMQERK